MNESPEFEPSSHTLLGGELHPDSVSERQGLSYLEGWHVKAELNRVFGVDGWTYRPELNCVGTVEVSRFKAGDDGKRIERAYWLVYGRAPTKEEMALGGDYLKSQDNSWPSYAQALLSANEFLYIQ